MVDNETKIGFRLSKELKEKILQTSKAEGQSTQKMLNEILTLFFSNDGHNSVSLLRIDWRLDRIEDIIKRTIRGLQRQLSDVQRIKESVSFAKSSNQQHIRNNLT